MTRALALSKRQVKALIEGAKETGYAPVVQIGKVFIRLIPEEHAIPPQDGMAIDETADPESFDTLDQYLAWRDRNRAREN